MFYFGEQLFQNVHCGLDRCLILIWWHTCTKKSKTKRGSSCGWGLEPPSAPASCHNISAGCHGWGGPGPGPGPGRGQWRQRGQVFSLVTETSCQGRQGCEDHVWTTPPLLSVCASTQKSLYPITSVWNEANITLSIVLNDLDNDWWHIVWQPILLAFNRERLTYPIYSMARTL